MAWEGEPSPWSGAPLRVAARLYLRRFIPASLCKTPKLGQTDRRLMFVIEDDYMQLFVYLEVLTVTAHLESRDGGRV